MNPHTDDSTQPCSYCHHGEPVTEPEGRPMCAECYQDWLEYRAADAMAHCWQGHEVELDEHGHGACHCGETITRRG